MFGTKAQHDPNMVWLNGPDAGKPVRGPARSRTYKVDHESTQLEIGAKQLSELDQVGMLEKREAYARQLADRAKADLEIARLVKSNQWLLGAQKREPMRWPVWVGLGFGVLILALLISREVREWGRPSLPGSVAEEGASAASTPPRQGASFQQGRGERP